ncbi:helix-turn-helix transcriptional regulator [Lachnoclostridium phytofermentans]|uniref:Transcriptional regulator, AraC family n=1 Tax=Lachnoclostridium phytofermentans (strain ATCC 700394 / DSM 18823 / ISDg) TaxID=357809 RepID=A9KST5_LACP7|nr:helix-turn-helix transcriptional regulator [Lachnoclostridium phytofermentans]ABX40729.1 transcriptional regulator, AraC family [Lachnoclostridium phytofermentans ISDg]
MEEKQGSINYKKQIFIIIMTGALLPVILLALYFYYTYIHEVSDKIDLSNAKALEQVRNKVENVTETMQLNYMSSLWKGDYVVKEDSIDWFMKNIVSYSDYSNLKKVQDELLGATYLRIYINSFYFINFSTGWVLTSNGMYPLNEVVNQEQLYDLFYTGMSDCKWTYLSIENEGKGNRVIKSDYITLAIKAPLNLKSPNCLLLVNLSSVGFERLLRNSLSSGKLTVFDAQGKLLFTEHKEVSEFLDEYIKEHNTTIESLVERRDELSKKSGFNLNFSYSGANGWLYVSSYDPAIVTREASSIIITAGLLILFMMTLIFLFSVVGSRTIYRPVSQLVTNLRNIEEIEEVAGQKENEFKFIGKRINRLVDSKNDMKELIQVQQKQLKELFVLRLLKGEVREENIESNLKNFGFEKMRYISMITISVSSKVIEEDWDYTKQDMIKISIVENMPEFISDQLLFPTVTNSNVILCTITRELKEELEAASIELIRHLTDYIVMESGYHANFGISQPFDSLMKFRQAYNESLEAVKNNETLNRENTICEQQNFIFYSDIANSNSNNYTYELILEKEMKAAVDECDKEKAFLLADTFINHMAESGAVLNELHFYLHRFMVAVILVATDAGISVNDILGHGSVNVFLQFNQLSDLDKIRSFYKHNIISPVIKQLSTFRRSNSDLVLDKIVKLVRETSSDITLTECADQLGYHPSYIWKIMKSKINMTFTDYVTIQRLEIAKKMLLETDKSVAEIAEQLKYTNAQNFIRFFSKHVGTTPGKFRLMDRNS